MEIRRYLPGEEAAIWNVIFCATRKSIARDYHPDLIERWAPHDRDMAEWSERLEGINPFVAIADSGEIVGMGEIEENGFIDCFYVHPDWQGRGVGKALLARIETEAAAVNAAELFAHVSVTAKTFFESRGFRVAEARSNTVLGHPAPQFVMKKKLSLPAGIES